MSSTIKKPNTIYPDKPTTVNPNYDKLLSIPSSGQPHVSKPPPQHEPQQKPINETAFSASKQQIIRMLIIIFMLTIIGITLSFVSTAKTATSFGGSILQQPISK
jgi:hypothetical protein